MGTSAGKGGRFIAVVGCDWMSKKLGVNSLFYKESLLSYEDGHFHERWCNWLDLFHATIPFRAIALAYVNTQSSADLRNAVGNSVNFTSVVVR